MKDEKLTFQDKCKMLDKLERMLIYGKIRLIRDKSEMLAQKPESVPMELWLKWVYAKMNPDKKVVLVSDPSKKTNREKRRKHKRKMDKTIDPTQLVIRAMKAELTKNECSNTKKEG